MQRELSVVVCAPTHAPADAAAGKLLIDLLGSWTHLPLRVASHGFPSRLTLDCALVDVAERALVLVNVGDDAAHTRACLSACVRARCQYADRGSCAIAREEYGWAAKMTGVRLAYVGHDWAALLACVAALNHMTNAPVAATVRIFGAHDRGDNNALAEQLALVRRDLARDAQPVSLQVCNRGSMLSRLWGWATTAPLPPPQSRWEVRACVNVTHDAFCIVRGATHDPHADIVVALAVAAACLALDADRLEPLYGCVPVCELGDAYVQRLRLAGFAVASSTCSDDCECSK